MAFKYYCTSCGHELGQENVLFDMNPLLLGSTETNFNFLHLYFTADELDALFSHGKPLQDGYYECELQFPTFLQILCGPNNYHNEEIANTFDLDKIQKWVSPEVTQVTASDDDDDDDDDDDTPKVLNVSAVPMPKAVELMTRTGNENIGAEELTDDSLKTDFQVILSLFPKEGEGRGSYTFRIRRESEKAVDGTDVLHGYRVETEKGQVIVEEARICCHYITRNNKRARCAHPVFRHAGTAVHKTIAFIGEQKSGKTSTIIALADYAKKAVVNKAVEGSIWGAADQIPGIQNVQLLDVDDRLRMDMFYFKSGIGPVKTPMLGAHAKPYNATFRVIGTRDGEASILTMTDLPGDLFDTINGTVEKNLLANNFPQAYSCQALVLCFDVSRDPEEITEMAQNAVTCAELFLKEVCGVRHANRIQDLEKHITDLQEQQAKVGAKTETGKRLAQRIEESQRELQEVKDRDVDYIPIMVTFNKCPDLENPSSENASAIEPQNKADRIRAAYFLEEEHRIITANSLYRLVLKNLEKVVNNAYYSALRIAPYGHIVPSIEDVMGDMEKYPRKTTGQPSDNKNNTEESMKKLIADLENPLDLPKPLQMRELMYWILHTAGCVAFNPAKAYYQPNVTDQHTRFAPSGYSVTRIQYRGDKPTPASGLGDVSEAFARCHLFTNPTNLDAKYVKAYSDPTEVQKLRNPPKKKSIWTALETLLRG